MQKIYLIDGKRIYFYILNSSVMVILLTGASRGIGAALAQSFTESGHRVLLVSRNRTELEKIVDGCNSKAGELLAHAIPFDLTDLTDLENEFESRIRACTVTIDALINNAGQLIRKDFNQVEIQDGTQQAQPGEPKSDGSKQYDPSLAADPAEVLEVSSLQRWVSWGEGTGRMSKVKSQKS